MKEPPFLRTRIMMVMMDGGRIGRTAQALEEAGYIVCAVEGLPAALGRLRAESPALLIVGGLPRRADYRALRQASDAPLLALLTRTEESDLLDALEGGADDCQPASIDQREVLLRVRMLLRRTRR